MLAVRSISYVPRAIKNAIAGSFCSSLNAIRRRDSITIRRSHSASETSISNNAENVLPFNKLPGYGSLHGLYTFFLNDGFSRLHLIEEESKKKFGPMFRQNLGPFNTVYVCEPDLVQQVYKMEGKYPKRDPAIPLWTKYREDRGRTEAIFIASGETWYTARSAMSPKMLKTKEVVEYLPQLLEVTNDLVSRLKELKTSSHIVPKIQNELFKWSFESIGTVLFEKRFGIFENPPSKEAEHFIESTHKVFSGLMDGMFYPAWLIDYYKAKAVRDFYDGMDVLYGFTDQEVKEKLQQIQQGAVNYKDDGRVDFLTFLIGNKKLALDKITNNFVEIMFAAVDTTSNTTLWTLYNLAKNPGKQDALHKEISSLLKPGEAITPSTLTKMHYLRACIKETLRLFPAVVENSRIFDKDITLNGYNIPKETLVAIPLYTMGRDPAIFDNPLQFEPERWIRGSDSHPDYHPFASLPFGHGVRMCIGHRISMLEMSLLISKLVREFHVESVNDVGTKVQGLLCPDKDVLLKLNERKS